MSTASSITRAPVRLPKRRTLLSALPLSAALAVSVALGACSPTPDLDAIEATFDAPPGERTPRVSDSVAGTGFGRDVARAVQENPRLSASSADVRAAQAREDGETGAFLPRFALSATMAAGLGAASGGRINPVAQVFQLIYDGGASASRRVAARARVFESRGSRLEIASALTLEAVEAWHTLLAARARVDLAASNEAAHRELLSQVEDRATAGAGGQADVLAARARLATATSRAVEARARRDRAEAAYQQVFGQRPSRLGRPPRSPALPAGGDDALIATSPRIRGLEAGIAAAEADVALARAARFPQVQLRGNATRGAGGRGVDGDVDLLVDYESGFPGQRAAAIRAAEARLESLQADRDALARQIRRALADLRADQRAGSARLAAAREAVAANEATVEASREQFSIGRRSLIGLLDAQRDLFEASELLINAEFELSLTGYAALALTGDILDAFAITLPVPGQEADNS